MAQSTDPSAQFKSSIQLPEWLHVDGTNTGEEWREWKQRFQLYLIASELETKTERQKIAVFLSAIGPTALRIYNTFPLKTETDQTLLEVISSFDEYFLPQTNEVYERYIFFTACQDQGESIDSYVTRLRSMAKTCEFGVQEESLIRDRIVLGNNDPSLLEGLLRMPKLTLSQALMTIRAAEASKMQRKAILKETLPSAPAIEAVKKTEARDYVCSKCGQRHSKSNCPAFGKECLKCGKRNHFAKMCWSDKKGVSSSQVTTRNTHSFFLDTIQVKPSTVSSWWITVKINDKPVRCKLDTGAEASVMSVQTLKSIMNPSEVKKTGINLSAYGNNVIKPLGTVSLKVQSAKSSAVVEFFVVADDGRRFPTLLGLPTCLDLNLLRRIQTVELKGKDILDEFGDVFNGLGELHGEYHIVIDNKVKPVVHPPRRVPKMLEPKLQRQLQKMIDAGIIEKCNEPTDWVSSLLVVEKKDGSLRLCLDPRDLNKAIKREHFRIPTCEDILADMNGKKVFTIIDMKDGYWQVKLDRASSRLCTFNTPFGRYSMKRMPFGISSAPEVFQKKTLETFGDIQGVNVVFDDLIIAAETEKQHDQILRNVLERARERRVTFNKSKIQFCVKEAKFLGHILTAEGVRPDEAKCKAILEMPTPSDRSEVQRFLGMVTYLGKFIPHLSTRTDPLRQLLKKDVAWHWTSQHDAAVENLRQAIANATRLAYFDPKKVPVIQTDASSTGMGSCLMQDGRPIAFASRSLTNAEKQYAQIEKELLAIVYACEKFEFFIYGLNVIIQSDHKPLEAICKKPIHATTPRLQRMLMRLMRYDITVQYVPGKEMLVADALSRAYLTTQDESGEFADEMEAMVHSLAPSVPVSAAFMQTLRKETSDDPTLTTLTQFVHNGFPTHHHGLEKELKQYAKIRSELYKANGILYFQNKLVIPLKLRQKMLQRVHEGHLGTEKCKALARMCMYWPGISEDIENFIARCDVCKRMSNKQQKETLHPHPVPERPWQKLGVDIFHIFQRDYLLAVDYHSKYPEIHLLLSKSTDSVIKALKSIFARHGIPEEIVADNVPFNSLQFRQFSEAWNFQITTSSPRYPQSNGMAERGIQTIKKLLKKAEADGSDPYLALLQFRNAPVAGLKFSPSQLLMSRVLRSKLPVSADVLRPKTISARNALQERQKKQKQNYDKNAKDLPPIMPGTDVRVRVENQWRPAIVRNSHHCPRSFIVQTNNGTLLRRNRRDLRVTIEEPLTVTGEMPQPSDAGEEGEVLSDPGEVLSDPIQEKSVENTVSPTTRTRCGRRVKQPRRYIDSA